MAVNLDVGTDNEALLNDPSYLGNRHARVTWPAYDALIDTYLETVAELFPKALLHFEDFGPSNARRILVDATKYRIFNDDLQGTGAIVMASTISALKVTGGTFTDQRLVVYGAGTAGTGMADQIRAAMVRTGLSSDDAARRVGLVDVDGLVIDDMEHLPDYQAGYARPADEAAGWERADGRIDLLEVVRQVKPTSSSGRRPITARSRRTSSPGTPSTVSGPDGSTLHGGRATDPPAAVEPNLTHRGHAGAGGALV